MRTSFIETLRRLAREDGNIHLLSADMGFSVFEGFQKEFPDRFLNMGISEANMASVAAGLSMAGKTVYLYSFVPFVTLRCLEQIRVDVCYHNADVKIIGLGGGLTYAMEGPTHHAIEDIAVMRALPNMTVVCPGDPTEVELAVEASARQKGPFYIRIGKKGESAVHQKKPEFKIGKGIKLTEGSDLTLIATGNMLHSAFEASKMLCKSGISARVISMHTVKPIDTGIILKSAAETGKIFTLEEHSRIGGLGSAVTEVLADNDQKCFFRRIALPDNFIYAVGHQECLRNLHSLSVEKIYGYILTELSREEK